MHITAVCPGCQTSFQVSPTLRGQTIRCPRADCRKVFTVGATAEQRPAAPRRRMENPPAGNRPQTGSVADFVPILPAEPASPPDEARTVLHNAEEVIPLVEAEPAESIPFAPEPPGPTEPPSWHQPPPVRRPPAGDAPPPEPPPPAEPRRRTRPPAPVTRREPPAPPPREGPPPESARPTRAEEETEPELPDRPRELPPGTWEPPPVRRGGGAEVADPLTEEAAYPDAPHEELAPPVSRKRSRLLVAAMLLALAGLGAGGYFIVRNVLFQSESELAQRADRDYQSSAYGSAADQYRKLAEKFPESDQVPRYRFRQEISTLLARLKEPEPDVRQVSDQVAAFFKDHKADPRLKEHAPDVGKLYAELLQKYAATQEQPTGDQALAVLKRADEVVGQIRDVNPDAVSAEERAKIDQAFGRVRLAVARWQHLQGVFRRLDELARRPSASAVQEARRLLNAEEADYPGIAQMPPAAAALNGLYEGHLRSVVYEKGEAKGDRPATPEDTQPSIVFDPVMPDALPPEAGEDPGIVLALTRGVLYALGRADGEMRWAMRVGVDTTTLPEHVPATDYNPELVLVLSADTLTLAALNTQGGTEWKYRLDSPSLGRPVVVGSKAYLATAGVRRGSDYDGLVHEIELATGRRVGLYHLGQRLTVGGAREKGTSRVYFPADDLCVYVLDVEKHRCETVLYSGHPSGSLRSEPVVIPSRRGSPGYLILNQTQGLDAMQMRVFALPIAGRDAAPERLDPPPHIKGWTWFRPHTDPEKVVTLGDAGVLGVFGVRQAGNKDEALFPELTPGGLSLEPFLAPGARARGRAQVVQVLDRDFWVLAHGQLQHLQIAWSGDTGPRPVAMWPRALPLGSPLHDSQVVEDPASGRSTMYLVTQPLTQPVCLATAVDGETGKVLWQRQLGMVAQGEPVLLRPDDKADAVALALDEGGGLFVLDPTRFRDDPRSRVQWRDGGDKVFLAPPLDENPDVPPVLLPGPDGRSAYEVAAPGGGSEMVVRQVRFAEGRRLRVKEWKVELSAPLAGTPAIVGKHLVFPMMGEAGNLARVPLSGPAEGARPGGAVKPEPGPTWRSERADVKSRCYVTALGPNNFLTTDGLRGLRHWRWPPSAIWELLGSKAGEGGGEQPPTLDLESRPVAAPLLLPAGKEGKRVCVADSAGGLSVLTVTAKGGLEVGSRWDLRGRITAGPFLDTSGEAVRIACVVDQDRLVWLDPARGPLWEYPAGKERGGGAIAGRPGRVGDALVVARQSGRVVALDPATGKPRGPGYPLRGSMAASSGPVAFGPGRALLPLSDGTALLLSLEQLTVARQPGGQR